ncbi:MAG: C1 family peptidase, partial [Candidatus Krumholzibacteria bacterium]|nr:C1 family peptidase [Candidatus Krumholzibacteria bacterium]
MKRNSRTVVSLAALLLCVFAAGSRAAGPGELDARLVAELRGSFAADAPTRALMNAVTNNDLKDLALNRELLLKHDEVYTDKLDVKGITNQKSSGRCWLFAGLNIMRPSVMKKYDLAEFEFSENHLFFWDKLEKANTFLETVIETRDRDIDDRELQAILADPCPDGGWWNYVVALIDKYGAVPKSVSEETKHSSGTGRMNSMLNRLLRRDAALLRGKAAGGATEHELRAEKPGMLKDVYRLLALHLGVPPEEFVWRVKNTKDEIIEKSCTPLSFYKEAVGVDLKEYVTLMDHPAWAYGAFYRLNFCRNLHDAEDMGFINLGAEDLKTYASRALLDGDPVWFAADIGKENNGDEGILRVGMYDFDALFGIGCELTKEQMVRYRDATPNHAMVFVGLDRPGGEPLKWL